MIKSLLVLTLSFLLTSCATKSKSSDGGAQGLAPGALVASVDEHEVELGQTIELSLGWSVPAKGSPEQAQAALPDFNDFEVVKHDLSSSVESIDGTSYRTYSQRLKLKPKKVGSLTIGSADATAGDDILRSEPITISVIPDRYKEALKTNACDKELIERYRLGEYFHAFAKKMKITPYDLVDGSSYNKKNIDRIKQQEAQNHFLNYRDRFPVEFSKKFDQKFESKKEEIKNKENVFNTLVRRDFDCSSRFKP